jgi:CheY-like chemotaxis protein
MRSVPSYRASAPALIVLADDNRDGILARQSVLAELGYTVIAARCGEEALRVVESQPVDLVITDYKMNPVNGVELIGSLRQSYPNLPIILLTGFAESLGLTPENTGANVVLQKSANELSALLRAVKRLLQPPRKPAASRTSFARVRTKQAGS